MELLQKIIILLNDVGQWFDENILTGAGRFLQAVFNLVIRILEFIIDILRWVIQHL